jgi:hypothetical protein
MPDREARPAPIANLAALRRERDANERQRDRRCGRRITPRRSAGASFSRRRGFAPSAFRQPRPSA